MSIETSACVEVGTSKKRERGEGRIGVNDYDKETGCVIAEIAPEGTCEHQLVPLLERNCAI